MPAPKVDTEAIDFEAEKSRNLNNNGTGRPGSSSSSDTAAADKNEGPSTEYKEGGPPRRESQASRRMSVSAQLRNPLAGMSDEDVLKDVDKWVDEKGLQDSRDEFRKGALAARVINTPGGFEHIDMLTEEEKNTLRYEVSHRWSQPFTLYFLVVLCAGSAIVQGMDQTAVNGAQVCHHTHSPSLALLVNPPADSDQVFYFEEFGITNEWQQGLLNGAPYLCSVLIGCWTNAPLNKFFGRRGTIFISCLVSFATGFWMAAANT